MQYSDHVPVIVTFGAAKGRQ